MFITGPRGDYIHILSSLNIRDLEEAKQKYFINFSRNWNNSLIKDKNGVVLRNMGGKTGLRYNPVTIGNFALGNYQHYIETGKEIYRNTFLDQAEWFIRNQSRRAGNKSVWEFDYDWTLGLKAPWISALAQGYAISTLVRAHKISNNVKYEKAAKNAILPFKVDISEGGVRSSLKGYTFYEEYPTDPPMHVLNGFIFALFGLYDCSLFLEDNEANYLFWEGVNTLKAIIDEFDTGYWTKYDLYNSDFDHLASYIYHRLHILQFEALYMITSDSLFNEIRMRWLRYEKRKTNRLIATLMKTTHKIFRY
jgi:hypothetical protein